MNTFINPNTYGSADFNVALSDIWAYNNGFNLVDNKKAIVRTDTGESLGIVSKKYKLVTHKEMINNQRKIIDASMYAGERIEEQITTNASGSKCFIKHILPNVDIVTPDGDRAALSFLATNSFDGTFPFIISVGARQGACMNGQIFTAGAATVYKQRHSSKLDIAHGAVLINKALVTLNNEVNLWHDWHSQHVTHEDACGTFKNMLEIKDDEGPLYTERKNKTFDYLKSLWLDSYSRRLGKNKWAVYNTLTHWATHAPLAKESNRSNLSSVQRTREDKISKTLSGEFFLPTTQAA